MTSIWHWERAYRVYEMNVTPSSSLAFPKLVLIGAIVHCLTFQAFVVFLGLSGLWESLGIVVLMPVLVGICGAAVCVIGMLVYGIDMLKGRKRSREFVVLVLGATMFLATSLLAFFPVAAII